jgi:hypothetical protein
MPDAINRYPSIRAFETNEKFLFIGREKETQSLFNKTVAEKTVLLFARSGIGKSSLIKAGLIPLLQERGFLPIEVRLVNADTSIITPIALIKESLKPFCDDSVLGKIGKISLLSNLKDSSNSSSDNSIQEKIKIVSQVGDKIQNESLWEFVQSCSFPLSSIPVFIFDQFEQFFNFPISQQEQFMKELDELLMENVPVRIAEWFNCLEDEEIIEASRHLLVQKDIEITKDCKDGLLQIENKQIAGEYRFLLEPPVTKVLIAIRSDKLFELNRILHYVPNLLRNRFELYPLEEVHAKRAIQNPAALTIENFFSSNWFTFDEDLLNEIMNHLKGGNNIIETTQLQILCSQIENRIIKGNAKANKEPKPKGYTVTNNDIEAIGGIEKIIAEFYAEQIKQIGGSKSQELARRLIEDRMYDRDNDSRKILFVGEVNRIIDKEEARLRLNNINNNDFINKLLTLRLIREDTRENQKFYEISHDYLLAPIKKSKVKREQRKRRDEIILYAIIIGIFAFVFVSIFVNQSVNEYKFTIEQLKNEAALAKKEQDISLLKKYRDSLSKKSNSLKKSRDSLFVYNKSLKAEKRRTDSLIDALQLQLHQTLSARNVSDSLINVYSSRLKTSEYQLQDSTLTYKNVILKQRVQIDTLGKLVTFYKNQAQRKDTTINPDQSLKLQSEAAETRLQSSRSKDYSESWFKKGYFLQFENIRITLKDLDDEDNKIKVKICDAAPAEQCNQVIEKEKEIKLGEPFIFTRIPYRYSLVLTKIDHAGYNIFKMAAFVKFSKEIIN